MIPVYLVILIGLVMFLVEGGAVLRRRKSPVTEIGTKEKIASLIFLGVSLIFIYLGVNMMLGESRPDPGDTGRRLISSTLSAKDVRYVSGRSITKTLADGADELKTGGTVEYTDSLYNKTRVSGNDVLEFNNDEGLEPGQVRIEKRLVKLRKDMMFKYGIRYVVVLPAGQDSVIGK